MPNRSLIIMACVLPIVAGCSSGSLPKGENGLAVEAATPTELSLFSEYDAIGLSIVQNVDFASIVEPQTLPAAGLVSYSGVIGFALEQASGPERVAGSMSLDVDFELGAFSGQVEGLQAESGTDFSGILTIDDGVIDRSANIVTDFSVGASISGQIANNTGWSGDLDGVIAGDFYNHNQVLVGVVEGTVADGSSRSILSDGIFLSERDQI